MQQDPILGMRYVDGTPIMRDFSFKGTLLMRKVMERFAAIEQGLYTQYGYTNWNREQRTDPRNNLPMLQEVRRIVDEHCR